MENMCIYFRGFDLSVCLIPSADKMNNNMSRTCNDQKPEKFGVFNISFDTVENELCQVNKKENIENLFNTVFEQCENEKQFVCFPYLS